MHISFTDNEVLQIISENGENNLALKYWLMEFAKHGDKMIEVVMYATDKSHQPEPVKQQIQYVR